MKTALIIIDIQNDYFPMGKMELNQSIDASLQTKDLLYYFRNHALPVIHIQHISTRSGATFLLPNTSGIEIHENVKPNPDEKIITKHYPNSFYKTELNDYLKQNSISRLVIAGMMTHMCVDTTVRAAFDLEYDCIVAGDCCATKELEIFGIKQSAQNVHHAFLAALNGLFSKVLKKMRSFHFWKHRDFKNIPIPYISIDKQITHLTSA